MAVNVQPAKSDRLHVDPDDKACVRRLMKQSGKSKEDVLAAIEKVGGNMETVERELGCRDD